MWPSRNPQNIRSRLISTLWWLPKKRTSFKLTVPSKWCKARLFSSRRRCPSMWDVRIGCGLSSEDSNIRKISGNWQCWTARMICTWSGLTWGQCGWRGNLSSARRTSRPPGKSLVLTSSTRATCSSDLILCKGTSARLTWKRKSAQT